MFPFTIKYSEKLNNNFNIDKNKEVLEYLQDFMTKKKAEDIVIENNKLTFISKYFKSGRYDILSTIEKGLFVIENNQGETKITYEFYMYRLFLIVTIMSLFIFLFNDDTSFAILCFSWLGGMNWLITIIRHKMMLTEITRGIDTLIKTATIKNQS